MQKGKFLLHRYLSENASVPLLTPRKDIAWEASAVFNPCVIKDGNVYRMLYRTYGNNLQETELRIKRPGYYFKNQISYIGYAESNDGINFKRRDTPFIIPDQDFDQYGCEDPKITKIENTFYITYTAIDAPLEARKIHDVKIRVAIASTKDFTSVKKHGIIGPEKNSKAAALFPETVDSKIALALTIAPDSQNSHVAVRYYDTFTDLLTPSEDKWNSFLSTSEDNALLKTSWWLHRGPELGAPPIKTDAGWLFIYSAESMSDSWTISAALSDLNEPQKLIARLPGFLLQPATNYELSGLVPNVTFPSGALISEDQLFVYYGAADTVIGLATCNLSELLEQLEMFRTP